MKNRDYKKLVIIATAVALIVGSLGAVSSPTLAKDTKTTAQTTTAEKKTTKEKEVSSDSKPYKSETVYAKTDEDGNVTSVIVSDQLKNINSTGKFSDTSTLSDIENVKGNEKFSKQKNKLIWNTAKKDICYQGTTTQSLPVGVKVTYTLDGKKISANDLKGKSGHLVARYQYENTTISKEDYVPFLMVTGLIFDTDKMTNLQVTNGKIFSDGDRDIIIGMGLPSLKEKLDVKNLDLDIPDYFELEADVTDYELSEGMTIATNDIFNQLDTEGFDSLSELEDSMQTLQDSSNKLVSGSGELRNGLDTLLSSSGTLTDGIDQLIAGGNTLKDGTSSLASGSKSLADGSAALTDGTSQLKDGTNTLNAGASKVSLGLTSASKQVSAVLLPGAVQLDEGVAKMQEQLAPGISSLAGALQQLDAGLNNPLTAEQPGLKASISAVNDVMNTGTSQTGNQSLKDIAKNTATAAQTLAQMFPPSSTNDEANSAIASLSALLERDDLPEDVKASIQESINTLQEQASTQERAKSDIQELLKNVVIGTQTTSAVVDQVAQNTIAINAGTDKLSSGASELNNAVTGQNGLIDQVNAGVSTLKNGTSQLCEGIGGQNGLANGLNQLASGSSQVSSGAATLNKKMTEAYNGAKSVSDGAAQLNSGAAQLDSGAGTLVNGLQTLNSGSAALIEGVKKLDDGAIALNDGMIQFNEEGIQKLVEVFDGDIDGLLNKVNTILDSSKSYKNFSGISDGMDGDVKFIFVTE